MKLTQSSKIESFIRSKYESRRWAMDGPPPSDPRTLESGGAGVSAVCSRTHFATCWFNCADVHPEATSRHFNTPDAHFFCTCPSTWCSSISNSPSIIPYTRAKTIPCSSGSSTRRRFVWIRRRSSTHDHRPTIPNNTTTSRRCARTPGDGRCGPTSSYRIQHLRSRFQSSNIPSWTFADCQSRYYVFILDNFASTVGTRTTKLIF